MLKITRFACENLTSGCVTDEASPHFSYTVESDRMGNKIAKAKITLGNWEVETSEQISIPYTGKPLQPFTNYEAVLQVWDEFGESTKEVCRFETGRMKTDWVAKWISDKTYIFKEKKVSPIPMVFRKKISINKKVSSAKIYATAMGIYEISLNGDKVGEEYFAPGFTSYKSRLQYQTYSVEESLKKENELLITVAGGWAVGSFIYSRKNRVSAERQALLLELRITYQDGSIDVIGTDESWKVTEEGNYRMADLYDGETYDARIDMEKVIWRNAVIEKLRVNPKIFATTGVPVKAHEHFYPVSCKKTATGLIYDFGQNFAGVVDLVLEGKTGQVVTIKHAEILNPDGTLNTQFLRTAKATATYICKEGKQHYSPKLTYMGFQYICIEGIEEDKVQVSALALYSDVEQSGEFECSDDRLNQLQSNIIWGSKSNFMDIPTDCPQRDERMGWTGDIALFAPTACYNFHMRRFLEKWLDDMEAEQLSTGGFPNTIPAQGFGFPTTMPSMAIDFWGDACILVPWAEYMAGGDQKILEKYYSMMKKYVDACRFWAGLFSVGKYRYIWHTPAMLHFGDWVAPDVEQMSQWQKRSKWTATASLKNTSFLLAEIAGILGKTEDEKKYKELSRKTDQAYCAVFTDGNGKLKEEFQTAYVLPLQFKMFPESVRKKAVDNLAELVKKNDYCIGTGFPGTPYILFALADNGRADVAYKMLLNEKCPSWLYAVKQGATTIWERWDGLDENGVCPIGDDGTDMMISYNHYASGAVGDFMYRRIAGIEAMQAGYKEFKIEPLLCDDIRFARGMIETPYGQVVSEWEVSKEYFTIQVKVPMGTVCHLYLPDGSKEILECGTYERISIIRGEV